MGLFGNLFSKNEESKDYGNMTVHNLEVGCVLEYDMRIFEVKEAYEYDWGDNCFSKEYKISDGTETLFFSVEEDNELELSMFETVKIRKIQEDLPEFIKGNKKPPNSIEYKGVKYILDEEAPGYFRDCRYPREKEDSWTEFVCWDYYDDDEKKMLSLEQWGDESFEASTGIVIKEFEISNILPKPEK